MASKSGITLLLLALLVSCFAFSFSAASSSSSNVKVNLRGVTSIAKTDDNFICATLDWWPEDKCDYGQCPWGKAGILNLDLKNEILFKAIKVKIDALQYAKDMQVLKQLVMKVHPDPSSQPKVLGPAGFYDQQWFNTVGHLV